MSFIRLFSIMLLCLVAIRCDISWGTCTNVEYELDSFELNRYLGKWYELARSTSTPFQKGDCTQAIYSMNDDGSVRVNNIEVVHGKQTGVVGRAVTTDNQFRLKVSFSDTFFGKLFKGDYQVVDTDYDNYAIVYSCTSLLLGKSEFYWILSRTGEVPADRLVELTAYVEKKFNKTNENFRYNNQSEDACRISEF